MRAEQPLTRHRRSAKNTRGNDTEERIRDGLVELSAQSQVIRVQLVRLLACPVEQLAALGTRVANLEDHAVRQLRLDVKAEVLHVSERVVSRERVHAVAHLRQKTAGSPRW